MKFSKYLMMAGAAAMLTACSSEEPFVPTGSPMTEEIANSDSYALISLAIPEDNGTRANATVEPETSAIETEFKVTNGALLLWEKGATEADATYVTKVDFTGVWSAAGLSDITREATIQLGFPKGTFQEGKAYAGLVVLNYSTNTYPFPSTGTKFSAWKNVSKTDKFLIEDNGKTYLTMTSSPTYDATKKTTSILVDIPSNKVKGSKEELSASDVIEGFYVHRNAAKVTVTANGEKNNHVYNLTGPYAGANVTVNGWKTDITATASYPVQNHDGLTINANWVSSTTVFPTFTRVHWGKGVYYGEPYNANNYNAITTVDNKFPACEYVKENTMKYNEQDTRHTTRVVLKATYKASADGDATSLVKIGNTTELLTPDAFKSQVEAQLGKMKITGATVELKSNIAAGYKTLSELVTIKVGDNEITNYSEVALQFGIDEANGGSFAYYAAGVCYYAIPIRHFDAPFCELGTTKISTVGDYEEKHEGRYGVLRNNWYDIAVNGISKIGSPIIPPVDETPNDKETEKSDAISFSIKMLNWAKRSQNVNL